MYDRPDRRCCGVMVLLLGAVASLASGAQQPCSDCAQQLAMQYGSSGPGLQASTQVCGADGFTYLHRCLAECQGVEVARDSSCDGMPAVLGRTARQQQLQAAEAADGVEVLSSSAAAAQAPAPVLAAATITKYAEEGMTCLGVLPRRTFRPVVPGISLERLATLQQPVQSQGLAATVMLEVSSGVMYAGGPISRSGAAVPELTSDGSDADAREEGPGRVTGRKLHAARDGAALSAPLSQASLLRGVRQLQEHAAAHQRQAATTAGQHPGDSWHRAGDSAGTGSLRQLSAIFGKDTRTEIIRPPSDPGFSPTGHLMFKSPDTGIRYQCTGALIGLYTVLTAAHCLVTPDGVQQANIEFTAGQTYSNFTGLGTAKGLRVYFNKEFLGSQWEQHDYGILLIDRPFGLFTDAAYYAAVMDIAQIKAQETNGNPAAVFKQFSLPAGWTPKRYGYAFGAAPMDRLRVLSAGYPGDKKFNSYWRLSCRLTDSKPISPVIMHRCPTMSGQSGAPLFEMRTVSGRRMRIVRAITSFELCGSVCSGACCNGEVSTMVR